VAPRHLTKARKEIATKASKAAAKARARRAKQSARRDDMSEVPLFPWWVTVLVYVWAPIGPIVGIGFGHWLIRSWERKRWIADNRKEEYRRILAGLTKVNTLLLHHYKTGELNEQALGEAMDESALAFNSCLFITDFLHESQVMDDVLQAFKKLTAGGGSFDAYHKEYWKSINLILAAARKSAL